MANIDGAPAPGDDAGPGPGGPSPNGGPPGGGGLLSALRQQQQGPGPSAPGPGDQGNSMLLIKNALDLMQQALAGLDHTTPIYRDVLTSMQRVTRHLAQGAPTAGAQQTQLGDLLRMVSRSALLQNLRGPGGGGGDGGDGGGGGGGGGGGPQPPMPSTPLPGA